MNLASAELGLLATSIPDVAKQAAVYIPKASSGVEPYGSDLSISLFGVSVNYFG